MTAMPKFKAGDRVVLSEAGFRLRWWNDSRGDHGIVEEAHIDLVAVKRDGACCCGWYESNLWRKE